MIFKPKIKALVRPDHVARSLSQTVKRKPARVSAYIEYKNVHPAVEVSLYYGFVPLASSLSITKEDRERIRELGGDEKSEPFSIAPTFEEKSAIFRYYEDKRLFECAQPIMFCGEFFAGNPLLRKLGGHCISFEIMGSEKSIAEATLIQTAFATLGEQGYTDLVLSLNSVGDRESLNRFTRELGNYYRKNIALLPPSCKALLRKNPLDLLNCDHEKCRALSIEAPQSIGFLGDESRRHFKEVLEFVEELGIPYRIDHRLLGNRLFSSETLFEIKEATTETNGSDDGESHSLCVGARYNNLGRRLGLKREVPSTGMNLALGRTGKELFAPKCIRFKKPSVFFLQLGFCAKLKSLRVIEILRQAHISLYQALDRDRLISQISSAENLKIPYSIILGQREALENSVIVRDTVSRAQETVKLENLVEYFRKMKVG